MRVLCLHSWRTSGDIFLAQWKRAGLDVALADLLELVSWQLTLPPLLLFPFSIQHNCVDHWAVTCIFLGCSLGSAATAPTAVLTL